MKKIIVARGLHYVKRYHYESIPRRNHPLNPISYNGYIFDSVETRNQIKQMEKELSEARAKLYGDQNKAKLELPVVIA